MRGVHSLVTVTAVGWVAVWKSHGRTTRPGRACRGAHNRTHPNNPSVVAAKNIERPPAGTDSDRRGPNHFGILPFLMNSLRWFMSRPVARQMRSYGVRVTLVDFSSRSMSLRILSGSIPMKTSLAVKAMFAT